MRIDEPFLATSDLNPVLDELRAAMAEGSVATIKATLARAVESYRPRLPEAGAGAPREAA
jgi:hypothetical protein